MPPLVSKPPRRKCERCTGNFQPKVASQRFCSFQCKVAARHGRRNPPREKITKTCIYCGANFSTKDNRQLYCTKQHKNKGHELRRPKSPRSPEYCRRHHVKIKAETMAAYGGHCACCGENNQAFLTIDHIFGRTPDDNLVGSRLYQYLKDRNWPKGKYQILCFNCNCAKGNLGQCPHAIQLAELMAAL